MRKINISIAGANGKMGKILIEKIKKNNNCTLTSLTDLNFGKIIHGIKIQKNNL